MKNAQLSNRLKAVRSQPVIAMAARLVELYGSLTVRVELRPLRLFGCLTYVLFQLLLLA